jgi:hypothetical protein
MMRRVCLPVLYPVFWMPAATPFMVRMRVSSSPGGNSVVGLSSTSSAARFGDFGTSLPSEQNWVLWSRIFFSTKACWTLRAVMYGSRSRSRCFSVGFPCKMSSWPATCACNHFEVSSGVNSKTTRIERSSLGRNAVAYYLEEEVSGFVVFAPELFAQGFQLVRDEQVVV